MKKLFLSLIAFLPGLFLSALDVEEPAQPLVKMPGFQQNNPQAGFINAAKGVFTRLGLDDKIKLDLSQSSRENGCPKFQTEVINNRLFINASSGVAMCHALYDYITRNGYGIVSWSGNRFDIPKDLPYQGEYKVVSPVEHHYYFNVVTYGYTMPYWDWPRWEKEVDWMAMHGVDMPLALVAQEAISRRVFKKLGITDSELAQFYTGPAHLPWNRMGNLAALDGNLPESWFEDQIRLQHQIIDRMRLLGMNPVCPAFAGFVPPGIERAFPKAKLQKVRWGGFPEVNQAMFMAPDLSVNEYEDPFVRVGQMFIKEWEKEFEDCNYYLLDLFNEMELPIAGMDKLGRDRILAGWGERAFRSVNMTRHNITWVMQGWMFGYQRDIWTPETLRTFLSRVPDEKVILLDLAADYNKHFWRNEMNWDYYHGFYNKQWLYSVVPNMGGKTAPTGMLDFYANGHLEAINSKFRGNLVGLGMAPEGIENNEIIYELLSASFWKKGHTDVSKWLRNYAQCRYGAAPDAMVDALEGFRKSVYGSFTDHPRFNWQLAPGTVKGSVNYSEAYMKALTQFADASERLQESELYRIDLLEQTAMALSVRMDQLFQKTISALEKGDKDSAERLFARFKLFAMRADACLEAHPYLNLRTWMEYTRRHGATVEEERAYAANARRIITVWGPPVNDYSARVWGGLIRSYYLPRCQLWFDAKLGRKVQAVSAFENEFVQKGNPVEPLDAPTVSDCLDWIRQAAAEK